MKRNLLLLISFCLISFNGFTQAWSNLGNGVDGDVNALWVYNNSLYAGGNFTHDGTGATSLSHVARWTGSTWTALGSGIGGNVLAMADYAGYLYVAGNFTTAGGNPASNIARWDGSTWTAIGAGLNGEVRCLLVFNGELYAGGVFTGKVVKLSGTTWSTVGGGAPGAVNAMANYNGVLYIGGLWGSPNVSKLSAGVWTSVTGGTQPDGEVTSLAVFRKQTTSNVVLWIGGKFTNPSPRLCTWSILGGYASSFNNFNNTAGANVNALLATFSYLYAGGGFDALINGSLTLSRIGKYSGNGTSSWDTLAASPNSDINAFTVYNTHLIAGGKFITFGGAANRVAIRGLTVGIDEADQNLISKDFFPNPVVEEALLKFQSKTTLVQPVIKIFNMLGSEVTTVTELTTLNSHNQQAEFRISRSGLEAGVYFYEVSDQNQTITAGKFIVE